MARIVINPSTFRNKKDALCVAFDEGFRLVMEYMGFDPVSEPTEEQRKFFAPTAYAKDEVQLRRTILARICTLDTSVKDPTDEQLQEAVEFLDAVMESGAPQNEWEQRSVKRLRDIVAAIPPAKKAPPLESDLPEPEENSGTPAQAAEKGGDTEEKKETPAESKDLNGDGAEIDHSKDVQDFEKAEKGEKAGPDETRPEETPEERRDREDGVDRPGGVTGGAPEEKGDGTDNLTIHIGAAVGISDSGGRGGNRQQRREPRKGTIEAGLHADNPANRLEGGTHTRDGLGGIGDGLHAEKPENRLEGGTHTRDGMFGAINKPITTAAEMGPKVSEDGRIDKPVKKDETRT